MIKLDKKGYTPKQKKSLSRLDIGIIVENLFLVGILTTEKSQIDTFRGKRNNIIHATGVAPTNGETENAIKLANLLYKKN